LSMTCNRRAWIMRQTGCGWTEARVNNWLRMSEKEAGQQAARLWAHIGASARYKRVWFESHQDMIKSTRQYSNIRGWTNKPW
jgi:hypothetical protein